LLPASNPQLLRWYVRFRDNFFGDRIPEPQCVCLRWEHPGEDDGCVVEEGEGLFSILLDPALRVHKCLAQIVLLHEVSHLPEWPAQRKHRKRFKAELQRLWEAGAYRGLL
jgi:hypothetical protein